MKFKTFYKLFYVHRFKNASGALKLYLYIVLPIRYFLNTFFFPKNLDIYINIFIHFIEINLVKIDIYYTKIFIFLV